MRNCFGMKEIKEIGHLSLIRESEVDAFSVKNISEATGEKKWALKIR